MSIERVQELIVKLQVEIKSTNKQIDSETTKKIQNLEDQLNRLLGDNDELQSDIYEEIKEVEYDFLTNHPVVSGLIREMVDILSKAGI